MKKLNVERIILVLILLLTIVNLSVVITDTRKEQKQYKQTHPIEEKEGYWVEETPDMKTIQLEVLSESELQ